MKITKIMAGVLLFSAFTHAHAQSSNPPEDQDLKRQEVFDKCKGLFKELEPTEADKSTGSNFRQQTEKARLALGTSGVTPAVSTAVSLTASDEAGCAGHDSTVLADISVRAKLATRLTASAARWPWLSLPTLMHTKPGRSCRTPRLH